MYAVSLTFITALHMSRVHVTVSSMDEETKAQTHEQRPLEEKP